MSIALKRNELPNLSEDMFKEAQVLADALELPDPHALGILIYIGSYGPMNAHQLEGAAHWAGEPGLLAAALMKLDLLEEVAR